MQGGFPDDVLADTILHETLHAIWGSYVEQEQAEEETVVTMLSHGMCQVIRDNKKFIEEITDLL